MIKKKESVGKLLEHGHCIWQSNWNEILAGFLRAYFKNRCFDRNRWLGIMIDNEMLSTVFDRKVCFGIGKQKYPSNTGKISCSSHAQRVFVIVAYSSQNRFSNDGIRRFFVFLNWMTVKKTMSQINAPAAGMTVSLLKNMVIKPNEKNAIVNGFKILYAGILNPSSIRSLD